MALAIISGLGSGALHAVTGPDHVLSLAPLAIAERRTAFQLGLLWGIGHALGTVLLVTLLALLAAYSELGSISVWSQRASGAALVSMGAWSFCLSGKPSGSRATTVSQRQRGVLTIGLVHGLTGAAALLLLLPAVFSSGHVVRLLYLGGFALGSTLAMGGLTWLVARAANRTLRASVVTRAQKVAALASVAFGAVYLALV
jgi:nickel/cobalt exporter